MATFLWVIVQDSNDEITSARVFKPPKGISPSLFKFLCRSNSFINYIYKTECHLFSAFAANISAYFSIPATIRSSMSAPGRDSWVSEATSNHNPAGMSRRTERCRTILSANRDPGHAAMRVQRELTTAGKRRRPHVRPSPVGLHHFHDGGRNSSPADVALVATRIVALRPQPTRSCIWPRTGTDTVVEASCIKAAT